MAWKINKPYFLFVNNYIFAKEHINNHLQLHTTKMKIIIIISFIIGFAMTTNAQNSFKKTLNEVIVSSNRAQTEGSITNIQIISQQEIENAPVQTIWPSNRTS